MKSLPLTERLVVRRSPIHGWGLFLKRDLPKHAVVIEYSGEMIRASIADRRELWYEESYRLLTRSNKQLKESFDYHEGISAAGGDNKSSSTSGSAIAVDVTAAPGPFQSRLGYGEARGFSLPWQNHSSRKRLPMINDAAFASSSSLSSSSGAGANSGDEASAVLPLEAYKGLRPSPHGVDAITMFNAKVGPRKSDGSGSCYLFRLDNDWIVDATHKGSAARFMNHCCEPNCYSEVMTIDGEKRILILALRDLKRGEEITYNYRFSPTDNADEKIPCYCGAKGCPGTMN